MSRVLTGFAVLLLSACSATSGDSRPDLTDAPAGSAPAPTEQVPTPPMRPQDRRPIAESANPQNSNPPTSNQALAPEVYANLADFDLEPDFQIARSHIRDAAHAFAGAVLFNAASPGIGSLNVEIPGHPRPFALPAQLDAFVRSAAFLRPGIVGADVGPTRPDIHGRVWLAVFQGAGGPLGAVESSCVGVTLRSDGRDVHVEFPEIPSTVFKQPATVDDVPGVDCEVDLDTTEVPWSVPQA